MPTITPSSTTWTLRLKHHKTTVLLHAEALQTLTSLCAELLYALRETYPDGIVAGKPLPAAAEDIQLAKLQDATDPEKGWVLLSSVAATSINNSKGKGKSAGGEGSLKAAGVKDNAVLAFRWGGDAEVGGVREDEDGMEVEEDAAVGEWDVVWARYEDTYMDGLDDEGIAE